MTKKFTHDGNDYFTTMHDSETEHTVHVRNSNDEHSRFSLTISHDNIIDGATEGHDFGLDTLEDMLVADFKRLVDEKILTA